MRQVKSSYKIFGGFGLLICINGVIGMATFKLLTGLDVANLMNNSNTQKIYALVLALQIFFLYFFSTQNRFIVADDEGITFINPLIPFIRSVYRWTDFDYCVTVDEISGRTTREAVWLIKDKQLKERFSSFYYSNYDDLLGQVMTTNNGKEYFDLFDELFIIMRLKGVE